MTKAIAVGYDKNVMKLLDELDKDIMDAGVVYFTAREVTKVRFPEKIRMPAPCYSVPPKALWGNMIDTLVQIAVPVREAYGEPLTVRNGYRERRYNNMVTKSKNSKHIKFEALDLVGRDMEKLRRVAADFFVAHPDMNLGFGFYLGNIHVDMGSRLRPTSWGSKARRSLDEARERARDGDTQPIDVT